MAKISKATARMLETTGEQIVSGRALCVAMRAASIVLAIETQGASVDVPKTVVRTLCGFGWRARNDAPTANARLWRVRCEALSPSRSWQTHKITVCEGARHD